MSFWAENKNTFKSAGIATAKGIGSGTKALSKAGYNTYKNHDSGNKGGPQQRGDGPEPPSAGPSTPLMDKDKLHSLPPPPKRTVPTFAAPSRGGVSAYSKTSSQPAAGAAEAQPNSQPQQPYQQPIQQPIQNMAQSNVHTMQPGFVSNQGMPPTQSASQDPESFQPPAANVPHMVPLPQRPIPAKPPSISSRPKMALPQEEIPAENVPQDNQVLAAQPSSSSIDSAAPSAPSLAATDSGPQTQSSQQTASFQRSEPAGKRVPKPAPDASMFAPPPVHRNRGTPEPTNKNVKAESRAFPRPPSSGASIPSLPPRTGSGSSSGNGDPAVGPNPTEADLLSPPPSYSETASEPEVPISNTGSSAAGSVPQSTRPSVKYVSIDPSKMGPPPPRRVNAPNASISRATSVASANTTESPIAANISNSTGPPPPPPPRTLSANSTSSDVSQGLLATNAQANIQAKPKKTPPPKPAKLKRFEESQSEAPSMSNREDVADASSSSFNEPAVSVPSVVSSAPNFAAEIAQLKLEKSQPDSPQRSPSPSQPQRPPKPLKSGIGSQRSVTPTVIAHEHSSMTQAETSSKPPKPQKPHKPTKPTKPFKPASFVSSGSSQVGKNDNSSENSSAILPLPKPVILPFSARTSDHQSSQNQLPPVRIPLKGQFQADVSLQPSRDGEGSAKEDDRTEAAKNSEPKPLAIPLTSRPSGGPSVNHLVPGFRVPVKGQFHHHDDAAKSESSEHRSPPPAPPSRNSRSGVSSSSSTPPPPPPARNYSRAPAQTPQNAATPPKIDLELATGWYANTTSPLALPASLSGLNYSTSFQTSSRSFPSGQVSENLRSLHVTFKDLSKAVYSIRWLDNNFADAVGEITKFSPSPIEHKAPTKKDLLEYSERFGAHITSWISRKEGQQVGTGECWDLARDALAKACGKHAFVSQYYHHGYPILELTGSSSGASISKGPEDEIRAGDILQFKSATLYNSRTGVTQTVGSPDHTAIVLEKIGEVLHVFEQNVQGMKVVRKGEYILGNMTSGSVTVYRPVPAEWAE